MKKTLLFKLLAISLFTLFSVGMANAQVFMTEIADPNNDATLRYIELYNAGTTAVDFTEGSGWRIDKYTNASVTVSQTLKLTGTIPAKGFYLIATGTDNGNFFTIYGVTANQFDGAVDFVAGSNGDDNLELYNGANILIDQFGVPGQDGTGTNHEFEDGRAERVGSILTGQALYADANWTTWSDGPAPGGDVVATKDAPADFDPGKWIGHSEGPDVTAPTFTSNIGNGDIDVAINTPIVLTFDEAIRNINDSEITNANVADLLTLKETDASGANVAFTATIDAAKKVITATPTANLKNSQVYYAAIAPIEDAANNSTTAASMTFTTIANTSPVISDVAITEVAPYYAGQTVTITWASSNVTNVQLEAWIPSESKWGIITPTPTTPSDGTETITIPVDAQYSADYKIRVTDVANALVTAESSAFTIIAVVNNLLALRAQPVNAIVKYTGIATVTYARTARNQKYIQDATAAVLIDDPTTAPGFITGTYNIGDGITNIVGKIILYNQLIEFTPQSITGEPATGTAIVPEVRTLASLTPADQCKLVTIEEFAFKTPTQFDATGKFVASKNYDIDGYDNTLVAYRTAFPEADYIGGMVPVGTISSVCLVGQFNAQMQITARAWSDMVLPFELPKLVITEIMYNSPDAAGDEEWIEVYNNGTTSIDMSGFYILDADPLHIPDPMVIPSGSIIAPGAYFTIETSTFGFFPFVPNCNVLGSTTAGKFNFGNTSDQVKIYHSNGQLIDSVQYMDNTPWPIAADGNGASLTLCDPSLNNSIASSWEASEDVFTTLQATTIKATPGTGCILHTAVTPKLQSGIAVYPNPTSDNMYISNPANDLLEITVLSSLGKSVKSVQSTQGITSVDLSDVAKGIYIIKLNNKTNNTTQMQKVVVK